MDLIRPYYSQEIPTGLPKSRDRLHPSGPVVGRRLGGMALERADIVIGDEPNETLKITGYFYNQGNIIIINDGVLMATGADFNLDGRITVANLGKALFDTSTIRFHQHYIYAHGIEIVDSGFCAITNTTTNFNGYPIGILLQDEGEIQLDNVNNDDWITAVLFGNSRATLNFVDGYTGEWLFDNDTYASFKHVNYLLTWYFFPDSSVIDFDFPEGDTTYGFYIDSTLANVSGIGYHVEIDSSIDCMWATIPLKGSDVLIRDSYLRVTGLMFSGADSFDISGLVNGLHYNDWTLPVADRNYHLINTTVETWNLYPSDSTTVELSSSIFGELCGFAFSQTTIQNAFCDGTGGHIEASGNGTVLVLLSSIFADVISLDYGVLLLAICSMPYGNIWANGSSIMIIVNTSYPEDPIPADTAIVFVAAISAPSNAYTPDTVGIIGSAFIDVGPFQPLDFDHYRLYYRESGDSNWTAMGDTQRVEVRRDTLDYWITVGLPEGDYELRLVLKDSAGDSVEAMKPVRLRQISVTEEVGKTPSKSDLIVRQVGYRLFLIVGKREADEFYIYDAMGRQIHMFKGRTYWQAPSAGVFYIKDQKNKVEEKLVVY